jgi:hypothetical protein
MQNEEEIVQITSLASQIFILTKDMLQIDEDMEQRKFKDVEQLELVFSNIPTKSLYQLQVSVTQEVQSITMIDAQNLETTRVAKEVLETVLIEVRIEHEEEKCLIDILEQRLEEFFQTILESALVE